MAKNPDAVYRVNFSCERSLDPDFFDREDECAFLDDIRGNIEFTEIGRGPENWQKIGSVHAWFFRTSEAQDAGANILEIADQDRDLQEAVEAVWDIKANTIREDLSSPSGTSATS